MTFFANFIPTVLQENVRLPKRLNQKTKERQRQLLLVRSFHLEQMWICWPSVCLVFISFCILYGNISFSFCFKHSNVVLTMSQLQSFSKECLKLGDRMAKYYLIKMKHFNKLNSVLDVSEVIIFLWMCQTCFMTDMGFLLAIFFINRALKFLSLVILFTAVRLKLVYKWQTLVWFIPINHLHFIIKNIVNTKKPILDTKYCLLLCIYKYFLYT